MRFPGACQIVFALLIGTLSTSLLAYEPVFSPGPQVIYKDGFESSLFYHRDTGIEKSSTVTGPRFAYGITRNWMTSFEIPYAFNTEADLSSSGFTDIHLQTKYRLWHKNARARRQSASILLGLYLGNADPKTTPKLGYGTNDLVIGLSSGVENLKWYRWGSMRYRYNGVTSSGLRPGGTMNFDLAVGWRPGRVNYKKSDVILVLEFNNELIQNSEVNDIQLTTTGGFQSFASPGLTWSHKKLAIQAGIQLPIFTLLNDEAATASVNRAKIAVKWFI